MKQHLGLGGFVAGSLMLALTAQPVSAAATLVTRVSVDRTDEGIELILETQAGDRPQIFTIDRGNSLTADIINTQLQLPEGNSFRQENPAPGISAIIVRPLDANSIRVVVEGTNAPPNGEVSQRDDDRLVFNFSPGSGSDVAAAPPSTPAPQVTPPTQAGEAATPEDSGVSAETSPETTAQAPPPETPQTPNVMVPDPEITIDGVPVPRPQPQVVPPFLPRAVAPPVGDIAVSTIDTAPDAVDLGTAERVPRLVLREAPAREVLALLARAANLNLAFTAAEETEGAGTTAAGETAGGEGPRVSLDIENEPVQDVFNYVLRIAGLEANRVGRTVFVGPRLPDEARSVITRTLRLNQISAIDAANFLTAQGAETQIARERIEIQTIGEGAAARTVEIRTPEILALRAQEGTGPLLLSGLSIVTNNRLNTVTLVGTPRKVEIASAFITQLDLRQRQVAVNVKIIDVNLLNTEDFGTSFSFGIGDTFFSQDQGAATVIFGDNNPPSSATVRGSLFSPSVTQIPESAQPEEPFFDEPPGGAPFGAADRDPSVPYARPDFGTDENPLQPGVTDITVDDDGTAEFEFTPPTLFQYPSRFLARLEAQIVSGNAKILTDPTLIVQEGQTAAVALVEQIPVRLVQEIEEDEGGGVEVATNVELQDVGLQLELQVSRIDDNGFITLAVLPRVSSPVATDSFEGLEVTRIARRELSSGQIRLRDGQTLILSGIIQETDRTTASKVPILGDIPILGALFRSTSRENQRNEVIVLVTPQIMDDSDRSTFGYGYIPGRQVQEVLQQGQR